MRLAIALLSAAAVCGAAVPATAQVSEADFIQANRCVALARSSKFDSPDAQAFKAFVEGEGKGRTITIRNKGKMAQSRAKQEALAANGATKEALAAELSGPCQAFKTQVAAK